MKSQSLVVAVEKSPLQ